MPHSLSYASSSLLLAAAALQVERALRVACELETRLRFHVKLDKTILSEEEIERVFLNLAQIYAFNQQLHEQLLRIRLHGDIVAEIGECMSTHIPFFKLYAVS